MTSMTEEELIKKIFMAGWKAKGTNKHHCVDDAFEEWKKQIEEATEGEQDGE